MLDKNYWGSAMTNEKSVNVEEVTSVSKIKLVVTDSSTETSDVSIVTDSSTKTSNDSDRSKQSTKASTHHDNGNAETKLARNEIADAKPNVENEIADPEKVMRDLPVDDFFRVLEQATPEQLQALIHTFEKGARTKGGTAILRKVIEVPQEPRTLKSIILWWEWRRPLYNIAVGLSGLPSIIVLSLFFGLPLMVSVLSGLFYLFFANICYTLGTPAELVARTCYKDKAETYGPVLLTLGTIFSIILTIALECVVLGFMALNALHLF